MHIRNMEEDTHMTYEQSSRDTDRSSFLQSASRSIHPGDPLQPSNLEEEEADHPGDPLVAPPAVHQQQRGQEAELGNGEVRCHDRLRPLLAADPHACRTHGSATRGQRDGQVAAAAAGEQQPEPTSALSPTSTA